MLNLARRNKLLCVAAVSIPALYIADKKLWYSVTERSFRAIGTGCFILYQYKIKWTPENSSDVHKAVAERIVYCCLENEGLYVKFGQSLSSMASVLPKEFRHPLEKLHDRAKTFELAIVKDILKEEMGEIGGEYIVEMSDLPVASASIAQVHKAIHAPTGKAVAVKIQKPNIPVQALSDLWLHGVLLKVMEWSFDLPISWTHDFVASQLLSELDFRTEAANSNAAKEEFSRNEKLRKVMYIPDVFFASKKVLITEWIDNSVKITDVDAIKAMQLNLHDIAENATELFAYQIFHTGNVHCDPHPGNLLVRQNPEDPSRHQIVIIDHGLYVHLSDKLRKEYGRFWRAMGPPPNKAVLKEICTNWGVGDFEIFVALTAMKRPQQHTVPPPELSVELPTPVTTNTMEEEDGSSGVDEKKKTQVVSSEPVVKTEAEKKKERAERQKRNKQRLRVLLQDTSKFPQELMFVGRCQNYIHYTNWAYGNPIDRVGVMARYARTADVQEHSTQEWATGYLSSTIWWMLKWVGGYLPVALPVSNPLNNNSDLDGTEL